MVQRTVIIPFTRPGSKTCLLGLLFNLKTEAVRSSATSLIFYLSEYTKHQFLQESKAIPVTGRGGL
jgi:hypothetical protein